MPPAAAITIEIIQALAALAPAVPEVASLVQSATTIQQAGIVTPEQEAAIRAQLDAVRALVDAA